MSDCIELKEVIYDIRARNGVFCKLTYPDHPQGCPNYPKCIGNHPDFLNFKGLKWFAVIESFDLKTHAEILKTKHQKWTERQCRCLLYWQNGVRSRLLDKAFHYRHFGDILLTIPEASGVHVFETMAKAGITIQRKPDLVQKIMLIGKESEHPSTVILANQNNKKEGEIDNGKKD